jgi:4-amino-4-deoxy-L-arabinose transferase-like glycosyltransferase
VARRPSVSDFAPQRWLFIGLAAFVAVLWLALLGSRPLFNPDEGRYAEIPREMLSGGDWVIPHLNGVAYVEKPPLQYWATAISLRVFGQSEFAARLYTALCALGTLAVVWFTGRVLWGFAAAWQAAAVLAGSLLFIVLGQLLTLDMSLTLYTTVSLCAFLLAQTAAGRAGYANAGSEVAGRGGEARRWMWVAWAAAALGVLTKGLVAAAIPAAVLVLYTLLARDFSPWRRLEWTRGLPLFLLIAVPWHALAAHRLPDFLEFFFVHEHLARYLTPSADREEVWWFFIAVFLLGSVPWTVSALRVVALGWRASVPRGRVRSWALSVGVGGVRGRIFLVVRLETHSLYPARHAGPGAARRRITGDRVAPRDTPHRGNHGGRGHPDAGGGSLCATHARRVRA